MEPSQEPGVLPPPPPVIPPNLIPVQLPTDQVPVPEELKLDEGPRKISKPKRVLMTRRGTASKGSKIQLLSNHFKVSVTNTADHFFHYSVNLFYEDGNPVDAKGIGRRLIDKVHETYDSDLSGKNFAYDGEKSLFTVGSLPRNKMEFTVLLDSFSSNKPTVNGSPGGNGSPKEGDKKRMKRSFQSKTFKVEITFAAKIPMQAISAALRGQESESSQEALRVLDILLRQHAAKQGCLLVRQSFFHNDSRNFVDLGGGVLGCRGFHSSFRASQGGLSLNVDGSTTTIIQPGPLVDFLIANQNVSDPYQIDWAKAKRTLKNLRIKAQPTNQEYRITGLSEFPCKEQTFSLKSRGTGDGNDVESINVTVYDYFVNHRQIDLRYSADLPCINVGKPKRPTYIPVELCSLLPLQRYTKALSVLQRSQLVEKSRQKPQEKMRILTDVMKSNNYAAEPMLKSCGITINSSFTQVDGRLLSAPRMKVGNGEEVMPRNGRWNFNHKKFVEPAKIENWAVVNFSARCDIDGLSRDLGRFAEMKGISICPPVEVFQESPQFRRAPPPVRVEKMFEQIQSRFTDGPPRFLLCLLPDRKNCDIYGPWKRKNLAEFGIFNQCLAPTRVNEQYILNVLLKINAKLGGLNSLLTIEQSRNMPLVSKIPTIIFGMDVSHGSPGQSDVPSIAAVVGSRNWPLFSRYRASVRSQSPKVEMIDSLFKPTLKDDSGVVRELLLDFYKSSGQVKPAQIIIFRDGVSESQFHQVLNIELEQIMEACKFLDESWSPKFTVIIAQKNHHTKFFQAGSPDNVPPGTVIDNGVCHPTNYDFYMCPHAGMIGTTRPTHYHVLLDEIGFSPDELQELIHSLSYVYQRSTSAISIVAPVRYAHLAATQISQFMKFDDMSDTTSSHGSGVTSSRQAPVPELPVLHKNVCSSMFFC